MIPFQLSPELFRFGILIGVLIFYQSAYKLIALTMEWVTSTSRKPTSKRHLKSPTASDPSTSSQMSSFHPRFRSSASNSKSEDTPVMSAADPAALTKKSEAARSAQRFLLSTIRDDWNDPPFEHQCARDPTYREPLDYRSREEASSDPEPLSDEPNDARDPMASTDSHPYKFESPDAVARTITERKRKRRRLFREELEWNDGLRTWVECRDAWCGAVRQRPKRRTAEICGYEEKTRSSLAATEMSIPISPLSQTSAASSSPPDSAHESEYEGERDQELEDQGPFLPVYPSLLPEENSIRASIKPSMYPAIYSKVVLQSLTPTVPVPLPDVIGAIVQGWKSEGNWPPQGTAPATSIIQEGGRRASELLKFRRREKAVAEKGRMRKGVGAVKKALGLRILDGEINGAGAKFEAEGSKRSKRNSSIEQPGLVQGDGVGTA